MNMIIPFPKKIPSKPRASRKKKVAPPITHVAGSSKKPRLVKTTRLGILNVEWWEQEPQSRTIEINEKIYKIDFPYVIFGVVRFPRKFLALHVFLRQSPLEDESERIKEFTARLSKSSRASPE